MCIMARGIQRSRRDVRLERDQSNVWSGHYLKGAKQQTNNTTQLNLLLSVGFIYIVAYLKAFLYVSNGRQSDIF